MSSVKNESYVMDFEKNRVMSVRELNLATKQLIEGGLPLLWVRGEP